MTKALSLLASPQMLNVGVTIALVLFAPIACASLLAMTQLSI